MPATHHSLVRHFVVWGLATMLLGAAQCPGRAKSAQSANAAATAPRDSADQLLFGARVTLASNGVTHGELHADSAYKYDEGTRFDFRGVTLTFENALGVKDGVLTARTGTYDLPRARVEFHHAQVLGTDGRRLQVEHLAYDVAKNQLSSDSAYQFTLVNPTRQQSGVAFTADPQLAKVSGGGTTKTTTKAPPAPSGKRNVPAAPKP